MYDLQDNAASDFANSTPVDQIGFVPPAEPMNCMVEGFEVVAVGGDDFGSSAPAV